MNEEDAPAVGKMALARTAKFVAAGEWPLVCKVLDVDMDKYTVVIQWFSKFKGGKWEAATGPNGLMFVPEVITLDELYDHSFSLTPCGKLPLMAIRSHEEYKDNHL